ncbi:mitochondrial resolvase Ydc2 [Apodospora peruviana]|uniref:Mitochondrial resolvase Ydc2 n=1 Tax=Apodospora peruviana TaxID=516989 RepID=A0AAE0HZ82_9PEZI|nr:mitochondrial resolvase Ydc2 [Apodospora peruviana]
MLDKKAVKMSRDGLQALLGRCGLSKTGGKTQMHLRMRFAAKEFTPLPPDARVLSVDLGIRNLAYCILTPSKQPLKTEEPKDHHTIESKAPEGLLSAVKMRKETAARKKIEEEEAPGKDQNTTGSEAAEGLLSDDKMRILEAATGKIEEKEAPRGPPITYPDLNVDVSAWRRVTLTPSEELNMDGRASEIRSEDFTPSGMAGMALRLVRDHFLPLKPTHILLERQRYRSNGAQAVVEWTIRVNTLEAMIYAIVAAMQASGQWEGGKVVPVPPRRVGLWLLERLKSGQFEDIQARTAEAMESKDPEIISRAVTGREIVILTKKHKVHLLGDMMRNGTVLNFVGPDANETAWRYWQALPGTKRGRFTEPKGVEVRNPQDFDPKDKDWPSKWDDLADCLLQGLTWMEWQKNMEDAIKTKPWITSPENDPIMNRPVAAEQEEPVQEEDFLAEKQMYNLEADPKFELADVLLRTKRERETHKEYISNRKKRMQLEWEEGERKSKREVNRDFRIRKLMEKKEAYEKLGKTLLPNDKLSIPGKRKPSPPIPGPLLHSEKQKEEMKKSLASEMKHEHRWQGRGKVKRS